MGVAVFAGYVGSIYPHMVCRGYNTYRTDVN